MNALGTAPRIDIELRRCGFPNTSTESWEFQAMNSFGQDFIGDELELRGFGETRMKLVVNTKAERDDLVKRMVAEGLEIHTVNMDKDWYA